MSLQIEKDNSTVTPKDLPRQEFLLPFNPVINVPSDQVPGIPQNPPQMITIYEQLFRMWELTRFEWNISHARNDILWSLPIVPILLPELFKNASISALHLHFNFDLILSIEIRSTVQHAGALAVAWLPPPFLLSADTNSIELDQGYPPSTMFNADRDQFFSNYFPTILNQQENRTYEFRLPLKSLFDRWYTRPNKSSLHLTPLGSFNVFVYSQLNTVTSITTLPVIIRYRLENIEYDIPTYNTPA